MSLLTRRPNPVVSVDVRAAEKWERMSTSRRLLKQVTNPDRARYMAGQAHLLAILRAQSAPQAPNFNAFKASSWMGLPK